MSRFDAEILARQGGLQPREATPPIRVRAQPREEDPDPDDDDDDDIANVATIAMGCSLAAFLGCGIASAVYFSFARDAIREKKVRTYNAEATLWRDGLATAYASKWTPPAGASPPRLRVDRGADVDPGAPSADETMTLDLVGPAARGEVRFIEGWGDISGLNPPMRGDRGTDFIRLERGASLVTVVENFHAVDRRTEIAENVRVRVGDDASAFDISVPAMTCTTGEDYGDYSALSEFLQTITLVEISAASEAYAGLEAIEGGYACAFEYTTVKELGIYDARNQRHAEALCRDGARIPGVNVSLTVVVRSPEDPLLTRGELTGCDFFFGVSADAHMEKTRSVGFAALALIGLVVILWCFIARRKIRRRAFGAPRGRK